MPALLLLHVSAVLDGIEIVEFLRRLYERELLVGKVAKRVIEEFRQWNLVGIEDGDELAIGLCQGSIDVACFVVCIIGAGKVFDAHLQAELTQCRSAPIVQHPDLVGIAYIDGPQDRHFQDSEVFVIGRNENVDAMAWLRYTMRDGGDIPGHEQKQGEVKGALTLCQHQWDGQEQHVHIQTIARAPVEIVHRVEKCHYAQQASEETGVENTTEYIMHWQAFLLMIVPLLAIFGCIKPKLRPVGL